MVYLVTIRRLGRKFLEETGLWGPNFYPIASLLIVVLVTGYPDAIEMTIHALALITAHALGYSLATIKAAENLGVSGRVDTDTMELTSAQGIVLERHDLETEVRDELRTPDVIARYAAKIEEKHSNDPEFSRGD